MATEPGTSSLAADVEEALGSTARVFQPRLGYDSVHASLEAWISESDEARRSAEALVEHYRAGINSASVADAHWQIAFLRLRGPAEAWLILGDDTRPSASGFIEA